MAKGFNSTKETILIKNLIANGEESYFNNKGSQVREYTERYVKEPKIKTLEIIMRKYQLILDIAGVIITNLSPRYWHDISRASGVASDDLKTRFTNEIREDFWTGKLTEVDFWRWLNKQCPLMDMQKAKSILVENLAPLPAFDCIANWSELADIHLLSNHRKEWIDPLLEPIKEYTKSISISSSVGFCKPNFEIYNIINSNLPTMQQVMFVDDQEKNLKPATSFGWRTLIADSEGQWIGTIEKLLTKQR
jgi:FMN phosphatase YigB (HAD superfamily)